MKLPLLILVISVTFSSNTFLQSTTTEKIIDYLGLDRYNSELVNNPGLIKYLEVKLTYGYKVIDVIPEKINDFKVLDQLQIFEKNQIVNESVHVFLEKFTNGSLNILKYNLPQDSEVDKYYKLGSSGKAIIIYSNSYLQQYLNL